ncbi:hypothetical protein FZC35_01680 [Candidatus Cytomitobacter indipagum]|uniref:Phage tail protein n=1 Tax=Candidatus Cytomitobacter indipagum TaxID=2601575 RepID=A0A5C0UEF6_9PROT|nr:hypothetical protein [Candidatus Cytomitobacter indipagum]QEK38080.1 hypothetical protein FZC35_01680 [Candidatus Cytomitobacter indipagum]
MSTEQDYTILNTEELNIEIDDKQTSGSDLFVSADGLNAKGSVKGFEKFATVKKFSESFRNNIRKDSRQNSASVGGTINSGFVEIYIPESIFAFELQQKGLSSDPITKIELVKTVLVKNERQKLLTLTYGMCNVVYVASQLGAFYFMRFAFDSRAVKFSKIKDDGASDGVFEFKYNVKESTVTGGK